MPVVRLLVVDDVEYWRRCLASLLQTEVQIAIVGEASDGVEAVQMAEKMQPCMVLLDGRRLQPGNAQSVIDVNTIPASAISDVERSSR